MQAKGIIKFFFILLTLVTLAQFLYMVPTRKVERQADKHAAEAVAKAGPDASVYTVSKIARTAYLDSMSSEVVLKIPLLKAYTYEELKKMQLALGLDLKGGMSTVLQVDLKDLLISLSNDSRDPEFHQALDNAQEALKKAETDYVSLFAQEWAKLAKGKNLSAIFSRNPSLRSEIDFSTSDADVIRVLRTKAEETVKLTFQRLTDRIDRFGVAQPNISLDASRNLIVVELPGVDNPERARTFLQSSAKLEFWDVYRVSDPGILQAFVNADEKLRRESQGDTTTIDSVAMRIDTTINEITDSLGAVVGYDTSIVEVPVTPDDPLQNKGPLLSALELNASTGQSLNYGYAIMGVADKNKINVINQFLSRDDIKNFFPRDLEFRWAAKPFRNIQTRELTNKFELYAIRKPRGKESALLEGDHVVSASSDPDPMSGEVQVTLNMNPQGAKIWADMTTKAAQDNNREVAIVLDDYVVSAPSVREPITQGRSSISGSFSVQEGNDLASILEIGKLPAKTRIVQEALVGPSLGKENIRKSLISLLVGLAIVIFFMVFYYSTAGVFAVIALLANVFFIIGGMASIGAALTIPGIAGIVLTIGMAVDANVIIYERVREELRMGKSMKIAIVEGFRHSYSAIIDANVTSMITAIVLAYYGLGPIKGFAVVLIIGLISSMFTAVLLGRLMIEWWMSKEGRTVSVWNSFTKNVMANLKVDWIGKRKIAYVASTLLIVAGITSFFIRGFELGVDFKGGYSYNVEFTEGTSVNADQLRSSLSGVFGTQPVVKAVDAENTFNITTAYLIDDQADDASARVMDKLHEGVNAVAGGNLDRTQFGLPDGEGTHVVSSAKVGPTIADDIKRSAIKAGIIALIAIFFYILVRFNKWQYSLGSVVALFHDALIVLSAFSLLHGILPFSLEIDQVFVGALLTIIGYSINDTVVIFDRIREYFNMGTGKSKEQVINDAVNSTMSRTIITSLTVLFVVTVLFIFGGSSIKGFAFALIIGLISGTYSTIFIASPILVDLTGEFKAKEAKTKHGFSKAATVR
ncbi:MAG TPA: protein translocase subunit SecDF [Saprospiraceae bacterium]|nr:protein translocase subunit SecDF [Saprospiraceae bacterium]